MAQQTIADGETVTVADGETYDAGPLVLDGTLELDGTADIGEHPIQASAESGATASGVVNFLLTGTLSATVEAGATATGLVTTRPGGPLKATAKLGAATGKGIGFGGLGTMPLGGSDRMLHGEKNVVGVAESGADAGLVPSYEKNLLVDANAGVTAVPDLSGERNILASAEAGATVVDAILESMVPLRRKTTTGIDNTRRDEFDTQGTGETGD